MSVEPTSTTPGGPAPEPLGWCSPCLGERGTEVPAVTLNAGTSLCRACNSAASAEREQMTAFAAQAQEQLGGLLGGLGGAAGPGRAGF